MESIINASFGKSSILTVVNDRRKGFYFELLPTKSEELENALLIQCELSEVENGKENTIMKPIFMAKFNEKSIISIGDGKEKIAISIIASYE